MKVITFNTGIEQILSDAPPPQGDVPNQKKLTPPGKSLDSHTQRLFNAKTAEQQLEAFVKPVITSPEIVEPTRFSAQYQSIMAVFDATEPKTQIEEDKLDQAVQLLKKNAENIALLNIYRRLLIQA